MRYIRFLKPPRIVPAKGTNKAHIHCLITLTSDLGDSFFPYSAELVAELIDQDDEILLWRSVVWTPGLRCLDVIFPLRKSIASRDLCVRIGTEHGAKYDTFEALEATDAQGIVSAWSAAFNTHDLKQAPRFVQRRFQFEKTIVRIWEETGESIARHLWDAGLTLSHHLPTLLAHPELNLAPDQSTNTRLNILELGTGCGILGMSLAHLLPNATITLSDLPEAQEIVLRNITAASSSDSASDPSLAWAELDWFDALPPHLGKADLVFLADCTYNPDTSPALASTLRRLAELNGEVRVVVGMKIRHESERVFFELMGEQGFREAARVRYELPGSTVGEGEGGSVEVFVYRFGK